MAENTAAAASLLAGLGIICAGLAYYNAARFGNPWETGRTVTPALAHYFGYGTSHWSWAALYGLFFSPAKGLFIINPITILGILTFSSLYRRYRALSLILAALILFRVLFLATRTDWHGGFCLGPRYLLMVIPFFLIPLACYLHTLRTQRTRLLYTLGLLYLLAIPEQWYFCLGEIFSYFQSIKIIASSRHIDIFTTKTIYSNWDTAPLFHLYAFNKRGPFLLQHVPLSNMQFWLLGSLLFVSALFALACLLASSAKGARRELRTSSQPTSSPTR